MSNQNEVKQNLVNALVSALNVAPSREGSWVKTKIEEAVNHSLWPEEISGDIESVILFLRKVNDRQSNIAASHLEEARVWAANPGIIDEVKELNGLNPASALEATALRQAVFAQLVMGKTIIMPAK